MPGNITDSLISVINIQIYFTNYEMETLEKLLQVSVKSNNMWLLLMV